MTDQLIQKRQIDVFGFAYKAEIDDLLDVRIRIRHHSRSLQGGNHVAVLAAKSDGLAAGLVNVANQLLVDRTGKHHLDDFNRRGIGNAQAGGELGFYPEPLQHGRDLRTPAMHHHRIDRGLLEQHDVAGKLAGDLLRAHGMAAVLDDDGLLVISLHVRQRLGQDARLIERADAGVIGHEADLLRLISWPAG